MYERPDNGTYWSDITKVGGSTVPFVVANPVNGPGTVADPAYTTAIADALTGGTRTFGYIQTNYQARAFKEAYADIDTWYRLYPAAKGIFIDLVKQGSPADVCYIAGLYSHVKNIRPQDTVVLGSGSHISSAYEPYGDIFLTASGDYGSYQNWRTQYSGFEDDPRYQNRFWHIVYGVSPAQYGSVFDMVRSNNAAWVYITDKTVPNPFSATPSYWQNEVSDVGNLPASTLPNRGKTSLPRGCISFSQSADSTIDTTSPKMSKTTSVVTVSNTSKAYDSEPVTQAQFIRIPEGATLTALQSEDWTCELGEKRCRYDRTLPAGGSVAYRATLEAGCGFSSGDAVVRLTNYAGNQWETTIPLQPPIGCGADTPAGKVNKDTAGRVINATTQSVETTPEIAPLTEAKKNENKRPDTVSNGLSPVRIVLIIVLGVMLIGVITLIAVIMHQRRRYKVNL